MTECFRGGDQESALPEGPNIYLGLSPEGLLLIAQTTDSLQTLELLDEVFGYQQGNLSDEGRRELRLLLDNRMVELAERESRDTEIIKEMEGQFH